MAEENSKNPSEEKQKNLQEHPVLAKKEGAAERFLRVTKTGETMSEENKAAEENERRYYELRQAEKFDEAREFRKEMEEMYTPKERKREREIPSKPGGEQPKEKKTGEEKEKAAKAALGDEDVLKRVEDAGEKARVSPLDPDFLLFALPFAILVDAIDIVLELTSIFVIPKLVGMAMDGFTFVVIGWWIYRRTRRIIKSREEQKKAMQKQMAQKSTQMQQQLAKGATKGPLQKTLTRVGATFLGELIPFVGLLPFWTISVILTLKEKGK